MRLLLRDYVDTSMHSLRINRLRSILTVLGIAIGVASMTTILSLSGGVTSVVDQQIRSVGGNVAVVRPGTQTDSVVDQLSKTIVRSQYNTSSITEADLKVLQAENKSLSIAPIMSLSATMTTNTMTVKSDTILATTPSLASTTDLPLAEGQFLSDDLSDTSAVVGSQLAVNLFGTSSPLGQTFRLRDRTFTIVGILKPYKNPLNYNMVDFDNAMIISFEAGKTFYEGRTQIQQLTIRAPSTSDLTAAMPGIEKTLERRHGERDFVIMSGEAIATSTNTLFRVLAAVMSLIAAISLLVGGIGVMNIMLVGVAERTREIGIRKAVGASNLMIVNQFLIEALMMSLTGGIVGLCAGVVTAYAAGSVLYFTPIITWQIIVYALATSVIIGVVFGIYPAIRAARKDPIESLRQYR